MRCYRSSAPAVGKVSSSLAVCQASICRSFSMFSLGAWVLNYIFIWLNEISHRKHIQRHDRMTAATSQR